MAAFLLHDKITTWFGSTGQLLPGGYMRFYLAGSTTPQDVYGDRALTTNNGDTIQLDASGRLVHECWADTADAYFLELYDADDVKQGEVSYREVPGGVGQVIPIPESGEYLSGDGTQFIAVDLSLNLLPDQTGHSNEILGTDGTTPSWAAKPADGAAGTSDIATTATSFKVGNMLTQTGTATGTSVGTRFQTVSVTFATAFDSTPIFVGVEVDSGTLSTYANQPTWSITAKSATGFTVKFTMGELDDSQAGFNFSAGVPFTYIATGVKA